MASIPAAHRLMTPHDPALDRFLYAVVGQDRRGGGVTVLSTLARLNLDPWVEAATLASLMRDAGHERAIIRLDGLLARFFDVPALLRDHAAVARRLTALLPARGGHAPADAPSDEPDRPGPDTVRARVLGGVVGAALGVLFVLIRRLFGGSSGSGQ